MDQIKIIFTAFEIVGLISNGLVFIILLKLNLASFLTTTLLRAQLILDMIFCLVAIFYMDLELTFDSNSNASLLYCKLWRSRYIFWVSSLLSEGNLLSIVCDRLWSVCYATTYKAKQKYYSIICFVCNAIYSILLPVLNALLTTSESDGCIFHKCDNLNNCLIFVSLSCVCYPLYYGFPNVLIIYVHVRVICCLRKRSGNLIRFNFDHSKSDETKTSNIDKNSTAIVRELFIGAAIFSLILIVTRTAQIIIFNNSLDHQSITNTFVASLCGILNPFILIFCLPALRKMLISNLTSKCLCHLKIKLQNLPKSSKPIQMRSEETEITTT